MSDQNYFVYRLFLRSFLVKMKYFITFSLKLLRASIFNVSIYPPAYFVVKSKKLIYIVNSKAACSTIKRALMDVDSSNRINFEHYSEIHSASKKLGFLHNKIDKNEMDYYFFTFVRNPFKRIVSLYVNKFEDREKILDSGFFQYKHYFGGIIDQNISFKSFVNIISKIPDKLSERHFISQDFYIEKSPKKVDFIGKLENFHEDYGNLCETVGIDNKMTISNKSFNYDYRNYYDSEILELVYRRYKNDVIKFGYEQEYEELKKYILQRDEKSELA